MDNGMKSAKQTTLYAIGCSRQNYGPHNLCTLGGTPEVMLCYTAKGNLQIIKVTNQFILR